MAEQLNKFNELLTDLAREHGAIVDGLQAENVRLRAQLDKAGLTTFETNDSAERKRGINTAKRVYTDNKQKLENVRKLHAYICIYINIVLSVS